jgi:RNA polymerase sigma-70 factor (ECF subfamily)
MDHQLYRMKTNTVSVDEQTRASEQDWINQARQDPAAFKPLYERYFRNVFLFLLKRVGDKELAGDLTQQVFLKALLNIPRYEIRGVPFSVWLFKIALNHMNEYYRKTKHLRTVVIDTDALEILYEEMTADQRLEDLEQRLPVILQKLDLPDLQLIELRFFESRSFHEIGQLLGITENNAKVKTYRTLERLKKLFHETK